MRAATILLTLGLSATLGCTTESLVPLPVDSPSDAGTVLPEKDAGVEVPEDAGDDAEVDAGDGGRLTGAIINIKMDGQVAYLLDEIPEDMRDRVAQTILAEPETFWIVRAKRQISLTRHYEYIQTKALIPLPPDEKWNITLDAAGPQRITVGTHDVLAVNYSFATALLSDEDSPAEANANLGAVGGIFERTFKLPLDPDFLYQRIVYDCLDGQGGLMYYPQCLSAVTKHVGLSTSTMHHERVAYEPALADQARVGVVTNPTGVDLEVRPEGLAHNRLTYIYIPSDSCAIAEKCVGGPGWRRVLQFDASVKNLGTKPLDIGKVETSDLSKHHVFEYSQCHQHMHFLHYGEFSYGSSLGDKRAFCLISTSRYLNNETTALATPYGSFYCEYQGIAAGWGDDYGIGLDCQWIDVTDVDFSSGPVTAPLEFSSNPDQFLCEGTPVTDYKGKQVFEPTEFKSESGQTIDRPVCDFFPGWDKNNKASLDVTIPPEGSYVTTACLTKYVTPVRDCGFMGQGTPLVCTPGETVTLGCTTGDTAIPQVVRVCEASAVLGTGVACSYLGSLANSTVGVGGATVEFTCPGPRDPTEPGGSYALYVAPEFVADSAQTVTCAPM